MFRLSSRFTFAGDELTVHGIGFNPIAARNRVLFNGVEAAVTAAAENTLTVTVPAAATAGRVIVISGDRIAGRSHAVVGPYAATRTATGQFDASPGNVLSVSHDGRHTVFSRLGPITFDDTNGLTDIFSHDRETGVTERVSVGTGFVQGNNYAQSACNSGDGGLVALYSTASNLVSGDTNGYGDIFLYNRWARTLVRLPGASAPQPNQGSGQPSISMDGGWVAFSSWADNLVTGDTNNFADIFLYCIWSGAFSRISLPATGEADNNCFEPSVADNGAYVAFASTATNLVAGDTNNERDVFLYERATGVVTRVSVATGGTQGNGDAGWPIVSADGSVVAFSSEASNLVSGDGNGLRDGFVHTIATGQTVCLSVTSGGSTANNETWIYGVSADGRMVLMVSSASNLVSGDTNNVPDVFVVDRQSSTVRRISRTASSGQLSNPSTGTITQDGATSVIFTDQALTANDTNGYDDGYCVTTGR